MDQRHDQQRADRHHREGQVDLHEIQDPQRQRVLVDDLEQERQAENGGNRAQLHPIAGREASVGIDHHQDEHGGERRDRGVGDGPGGEPLQQEHEQRKHHQEMEQVRQLPTQRAEIFAQLVMAERRRQQQQRRQQQRAEAQRVSRDPS